MEQKIIDSHHQKCEASKKAMRDQGHSGEWDNEPNRLNWKHAGLDCMMVRNHMLVWCGYVGVPSGHPLYKKSYQDVIKSDGDGPDVHGGLTYSDACQGVVCHVPEDGKDDQTWWFGFDCGHAWDFIPKFLQHKSIGISSFARDEDIYRNVAYVTEQTAHLAEQLSKWPSG